MLRVVRVHLSVPAVVVVVVVVCSASAPLVCSSIYIYRLSDCFDGITKKYSRTRSTSTDIPTVCFQHMLASHVVSVRLDLLRSRRSAQRRLHLCWLRDGLLRLRTG